MHQCSRLQIRIIAIKGIGPVSFDCLLLAGLFSTKCRKGKTVFREHDLIRAGKSVMQTGLLKVTISP